MKVAFLLTLSMLAGCHFGGDASNADAGSGSTCDALDLHDCRLRADCAADLCIACSCTPSFHGCRDADATPFQCPDVECVEPSCCGAQMDCAMGGGSCFPPGESPGCGACNPDPGDCTVDTECAVASICEPITCACAGGLACTPGCTDDAGCAIGQSCSGGDHPRCVASACGPSYACPADFDCESGACARRACSADTDCDGFCVNGACHEGHGACLLPPP